MLEIFFKVRSLPRHVDDSGAIFKNRKENFTSLLHVEEVRVHGHLGLKVLNNIRL